MNSPTKLIAVWIACICIMVLVDWLLGDKAEFINAWSAVQRALGMDVTAGPSVVYESLGAAGELCLVLLINMIMTIIISISVTIGMNISREISGG